MSIMSLMKRFLILILFVTILGGVFVAMFSLGKRSSQSIQENSKAEATPQVKGASVVEVNGQEYSFAYIKVSDTSKIKLVPNYSEQKTSEEILGSGPCKNLVNAGFYTKDFKPIGLFVENGKVIKKEINSETFNGFFTIDNEGWPAIGEKAPAVPIKYGLQSGPILILNSQVRSLTIANDDGARRITVAENSDKAVYFIVIYKSDSVFLGPTLSSLPQVILEVEKVLNENFTSAINLDGGSASAFWADAVSLKELSPIGSYFCIN